MEAMTEDKALTAEDEGRLDDFYRAMEVESSRSLGYPSNAVFDYSDLYRFLHFPLNNIGDPFVESTFRVHSRSFERDVLRFFAKMYHAPEDDYWGYVTSGGTEGNMYGLYLARELLPEGIVYYSEETHYSVSKVLRVLALRNIMIKTLANGEIDYEDLRETVRIHRDVPPIILANIGTTMKGAVDNVDTIQGILRDFALPNFYIHCDAALSGMILPFVKDPEPYDFAAGIDSISVSGHKMIGSPMPCGVVLAKKKNVDRIARSVEYVGTLDTTISRSRNGLSPLFLWSAIRKLGPSGFREMRDGRRVPEDGGLRDRSPSREGHRRLAQQQFRYGRLSPAGDAGTREVADRGLPRHRPHDHYAPRDSRSGRRARRGHRRYRAMKQITVVTESSPGLLAQVSEILAERGINIETLNAETVQDYGVVIFTVDRYDEALVALRDAGVPAVSEDAIIIRIADEPGALARISRRFHDAEIRLRSVRIIRRDGGHGLVALSTERTERALDLVKDVLIS